MEEKQKQKLEILKCRKLIMKAFLMFENKECNDEIIELYKDDIIKFLIYDKFPNKGLKKEKLKNFLNNIEDKEYSKNEKYKINGEIYKYYKQHEGIIVLSFNKQYLYKYYVNLDVNRFNTTLQRNNWTDILDPYEYFVFCVVRTNINKTTNINSSIGTFSNQYIKAKLIEYLNVPTEIFRLIYSLDSKYGYKWENEYMDLINKEGFYEQFNKREQQLLKTKMKEIVDIKKMAVYQICDEDKIEYFSYIKM